MKNPPPDRDRSSGTRWYAAGLAFPIPHALLPLRLSVADILILPLILQEGRRWWSTRDREPSTLSAPLMMLCAATAVAAAIGYARTGEWSTWALLNKTAGIWFQTAIVLTLVQRIRTVEDVQRLARWFIAGVSIANIAALLVAVVFAGHPNAIFSSRLFGLMGQPTVTAGLLMVAAMMELGMLARAPQGGDRRGIRWANLWLLGLALVLTVSRSTWLAVVAASASLAVGLLFMPGKREPYRVRHLAAVGVWVIIPASLLGNILAKNLAAGVELLPDNRAETLRAEVIGRCAAEPALEFCRDVVTWHGSGAQTLSSIPSGADAATTPSSVGPTASSESSVAPPALTAPGAAVAAGGLPGAPAAAAAPELSGALLNARGLNDRFAILRVAWQQYSQDVRSMVFGIGLGTFYATSAEHFGVPLIIHNTFAWYLVEFGPLGLALVLWLWMRTGWNLWVSMQPGGPTPHLAAGLLAALAGFVIFCLFNEGFYQRQLWLIMLLADRLVMITLLSRARETEIALGATPHPAV